MNMADDTKDDGYLENLETLANESAKIGPMAMVVPMHAATGPIKRGPGRPRKINPKPTIDDLAYHAEMQKQKAKYIDNVDAVTKAVKGHLDPLETLQRIKEEIATEAASLYCDRLEASKYGKDTTQISSRRIAALKEVASIELEMRKLGVNFIDLKSERFQRIFSFFIETIRKAASETLSPEQVDMLFNRLETELDGWEEKAQNV
jgi:hypothetical protein